MERMTDKDFKHMMDERVKSEDKLIDLGVYFCEGCDKYSGSDRYECEECGYEGCSSCAKLEDYACGSCGEGITKVKDKG